MLATGVHALIPRVLQVTGGLETYSSDGELGGRPHGVERKKTWMNSVCRNTMPQAEVDDYLATYRWIPPPFFMITISLAQVSNLSSPFVVQIL